jgi:hypothetical protein
MLLSKVPMPGGELRSNTIMLGHALPYLLTLICVRT